ncbi:MAG: hypothetical protein H7A40_05825 [Chlamydiales bacterium]|nr:hypothetical protein [Chlamydiales bacterium]
MQISASIQSSAAKACSALTSTWSTNAGKVKICAALAVAGGVLYLAYRNRTEIQSMIGRVFSSSSPQPPNGGDDKPVGGPNDPENPEKLNDPDLPPDDDEEEIKTDNEKSAKGSDADSNISGNESEEANESDEAKENEKSQKQTGELKAKEDDGLDEIDEASKAKKPDNAEAKDFSKPDDVEKQTNERRPLPSTPPRKEEEADIGSKNSLSYGDPRTPTKNSGNEYTATLSGYEKKSLLECQKALTALGPNPNPGQARALNKLINDKSKADDPKNG